MIIKSVILLLACSSEPLAISPGAHRLEPEEYLPWVLHHGGSLQGEPRNDCLVLLIALPEEETLIALCSHFFSWGGSPLKGCPFKCEPTEEKE